MTRPKRLLAPLVVIAALGLTTPCPALAQEAPPMDAPPEPSADNGQPWYGYAVFGLIACVALFAVCKTARR